VNKDELIKLLQDEKVAKTILNLVKKITIKKMRSKSLFSISSIREQ